VSAEARPGLTFGRVASEYERARPEYPPEALDRATLELGLSAASTVLDLAAGTGKLTRPLAERFAHVTAVEPDDAMRACIAGDARSGTAESIPLEDGSVDAVFVGSAFHWFDWPRALAEIRRVIRPGAGGLAILGNPWPIPAGGPARDALDVVWARFNGEKSYTGIEWKDIVEAELGPLGYASWTQELVYDGDLYTDLCLTGSTPAALPDDERAELRRTLAEHLAGEHRLSVETSLYWVCV
jgi:SAM-dependent methyltransferase